MMGLSIEAVAKSEEDDLEAAEGGLVAKLDSKNLDELQVRAAVTELPVISRGDERCRRYIADAGGIEALVSVLQSSASDCEVQENAITTLLNLSIDPLVRLRITQTYSALEGHTGFAQRRPHSCGQGELQSSQNAAAVLLALCVGRDDIVFDRVASYNHQIVSSLCSLSVIGSDRAKRKANELMRMLVVSDSPSTVALCLDDPIKVAHHSRTFRTLNPKRMCNDLSLVP